MKIDTAANHQFISQRTKTTGHTTGQADASASFAAISKAHATQAAPADSSTPEGVNQVDFTNMTRQEMYDWMNSQIRSGKMSFADSRPFLGLTFKDSDMATDTTRINFIEKARQGIDWALSRNDKVMAERLRMALEIMHGNRQQGETEMSVTGVSGTSLFPGSMTLTRAQAEARGITSYETTNKMTGEKSESFTASLSGYSRSLLKNAEGGFLESAEPTQMGNFVARHYAGFGPTQGSLYRMDALRAAAAEDRPAVEQVFADQLAQAGIDPESSFTMTRIYNSATRQYDVKVNHDYAKWHQVEDVLNNTPALRNDVLRVWEQQTGLASMRIVEGVLQEGAAGGQNAIDQAWLNHGSNDLAQSQLLADTLTYRAGRIVSPSMTIADKVRGEG